MALTGDQAATPAEPSAVSERPSIRFRFENPDGSFIAEQQANFAVTNGKIDWLRILCSGGIPDGQ